MKRGDIEVVGNPKSTSEFKYKLKDSDINIKDKQGTLGF